MKSITLLLITITVLLLCVTVTGHALVNSYVQKANEFMDTGMYLQAIALLEKELYQRPKNAEAHYKLGICLINEGKFRKADKRFSSAVNLKSDYGYKIGRQLKQMADLAISKRKPSAAAFLFDKAVNYDPSYKKQGYDFFISLGDTSQSDQFYSRALKFAGRDKNKKRRVGLKYLNLAANEWPGTKCDSLKQKASRLLGEHIVQSVFPSPYMKYIFEETYTEEDADEQGIIYTFPWNAIIKEGDVVDIKGTVPGKDIYDAEEIQIMMDKIYNPKWILTKKGYHSITIEQVPAWGRAAIRIKKGKGISVIVRVMRTALSAPDMDLLSSYLKK